tara:strand:+ start:120 stop:737 length:618 start_codon:yes stop_codon:yes gene_type:complete
MKNKICILNYESGNVGSVSNMLRHMGYNSVISNDEKEIRDSTHIILPGVGSFGNAMKKINNLIPIKILENEVFKQKKPFLGICVGMQILAEKGFEHGENVGLGWIKGNVIKIESKNLPLPNIGWNDIIIKKKSIITENLDKAKDFYFVHSYVFNPANKNNIVAETVYEKSFCSIVQDQNIFGVQFHPEKSQKTGMILLKNFLDIK